MTVSLSISTAEARAFSSFVHSRQSHLLEGITIATLLYKLGDWAVRHKKSVISGAFLILLVLALGTVKWGPSFDDALTIPGTPAEEANDVLEDAFSGAATGAQADIVFQAPEGEALTDADNQQAINDLLTTIQESDDHVETIAPPSQLQNFNDSETVGYATVTFDEPAEEVPASSIENLEDSVDQTRDQGIQTELTGDIEFSGHGIGSGEILGIVVAFLVLAVTFASFLAAGMPIFSAMLGLGISLLLIVIGSNFVNIQGVSLSLAAMLGIAVGIDYSLFIMTRFRKQLAEGHSVREAAAIANGTAGSAVVFAGITVMIGLLGLSITGIPFLTMMGIGASISILMAVFVAIIVLPALLGALGHRITPFKSNRFLNAFTRTSKGDRPQNKWGGFVTKRPWLVTIISTALLVTIALPFTHVNLGLPTDGTAKQEDTTEHKAYDLQTEAYGEGVHATLTTALQVDDSMNQQTVQQTLQEMSTDLEELDAVDQVAQPIPNEAGDTYIVSVTPTSGPNDPQTKNLVEDIRSFSYKNTELFVTGTTAVNIDISDKLQDALPIFALFVVGFAYVLLVLVFRSVLLPLKAVLGFLLSLAATLGFVVFVIQDGHLLDLFGFPGESAVLAFLPIISIGILFGLAMDYEVFLVSRMREVYTQTGDPQEAILAGMRDNGKVVVAAGLIMMAVFIGFIATPDAMVKSIGLSLTFGVLFDAFVVRLTIVPAVMKLMGRAAWYMPRWLDRLLPDIDVEGEKLSHRKNQDK